MNKPKISPKEHGFALIATILLMVLLAIITVGSLSLSVVTLRSSTQNDAQAKARANARMALMLAIGELQRLSGSDTRVTASANIIDKNYPDVLGVWRSWEGSDHETPSTIASRRGRPFSPNYNQKDQPESSGGRFIDWLVSTSANDDTPNLSDPPSLVSTSPEIDTIPLLAEGSLTDADINRQIHVIPTKVNDDEDVKLDGHYAWWVSGENQKARLAQPYQPRNDNVAGYAEMGQTHTIPNPGAFGLNSLIGDSEPHNPDTADAKPGRKAVSRQTMYLIEEDNATRPDKKFHDLTSYSIGLQTNTATGGWKKDLSILTERWSNINGSYPGGRLPLFRYTPTAGVTATTQVPNPTVAGYDIDESNFYPWSRYSLILGAKAPSTYHAASASWTSLVNFATAYKNFSYNGSHPTSNFQWNIIASQRPANFTNQHFYDHKHKQRIHPQIARFDFIVYARAIESPVGMNPKRYQIWLNYVPCFTMWNPYNVAIQQTIDQTAPLGDPTKTRWLGFGWRRTPPGAIAIANRATCPTPTSVPNSQYRLLTPGNFQTLDRPGNNVNPYDTGLAANIAKQYNQRWVDKRTFGCWFPNGTLSFKPGEVKIFSPDIVDPTYGFSGVIRLKEGYNPTNIVGVQFSAVGNLLATQSFWFLMKTDRLTQPFLDRQPGQGFSLSFGDEGPAGTTHYGGGSMPTGVGQNEFHNLTALASNTNGTAYWPPTEVDEIAYSVAELASGPWIPIFNISFGPRTTIGTAPGTEQSRPTKGVLQSNPLSGIVLSDPSTTASKDHPVNNTYDFAYHSLPLGSTITPNLTTSNGFIATGHQSGDGLSRLVMVNLPIRPMASLIELQGWNPKGSNPYPPFQHNLIGNSDATPLIPKNQVIPTTLTPASDDLNLVHDDTYCSNHLLFDDWFLSSIAPDPDYFGSGGKDISTVYREFLKGERRLVNRAYLPITDDSKVTDAVATTRIGEMITSSDGWLKVASRLEVEGMFNVNSTSVDAWKALLGHAKSMDKIAVFGANSIDEVDLSNEYVVSSGSIAADTKAGSTSSNSGQFGTASEYTGFRSLSDQQIQDLAEKVVEQVRARGPFLSLSEFINRQLSNDNNLALAGAIQSAINNLSQDPMSALRNPANSLSDNTMAATDPRIASANYAFPEASVGSSAYGAPGWIRQADVLRPIAPIITVRDDTFTIRAYGDYLDNNEKVVARAWCEAVVKRTRDFYDQSDAADSINPPTNTSNQIFGRRYEIIAFRWLNMNEI